MLGNTNFRVANKIQMSHFLFIFVIENCLNCTNNALTCSWYENHSTVRMIEAKMFTKEEKRRSKNNRLDFILFSVGIMCGFKLIKVIFQGF